MTVCEKAKMLNAGMALQKKVNRMRNGKQYDIYCGDEYTADFLMSAIGQLELNAECKVYTVDGEYFVKVKRSMQ